MPFAFQLLAVHGPMARRIADLRLAFENMCSRSGGDPFHVAAPFAGPSLRRPLRVAVIRDPGGQGVNPDIASAIDCAARGLLERGYIVEEAVAPALERANELYFHIMSRFGRTTPEIERAPVGVVSVEFDRFWSHFYKAWDAAAGQPTHDPMMERASIARQWCQIMDRTPLLLTPIATEPAWPVGTDLHPDFGPNWLRALRMAVVVNFLGLPSVAITVGVTDNLPQVIQIIGPRFREDLCLEAAEAIEAGVPILTPIDPE